ncbi:MAG: DUF3006 family protein [Carnobacterium sp.]|uniref:DUF3006 family protein n=1 Tax=Carnobacterium antarcticum TaxID=2126436 RepID=A0ABW4NPK0_9LACT|nr:MULTISPECIES: DUF3006 family protein [unclassified Carnobacterium]ALV20681.1 hypothetical protein NY10_54 [Carnobacterium sp. CP1]QQP70917.1 DUF3006 family protein [Carnobacterium sp. CS13]
MKVVLEEIEGAVARLIPDDGSEPIHIAVQSLPVESELGDVFEIDYQRRDNQTAPQLTLLPNEKSERMARMKAKREALLKKTKQQQQDNNG